MGTVFENLTNAIVFYVFGLAETHETGLDSARNRYGQFAFLNIGFGKIQLQIWIWSALYGQIGDFIENPPTFSTFSEKIGTVIENLTNAIVFYVFGLAETHETGPDGARNRYGQFGF